MSKYVIRLLALQQMLVHSLEGAVLVNTGPEKWEWKPEKLMRAGLDFNADGTIKNLDQALDQGLVEFQDSGCIQVVGLGSRSARARKRARSRDRKG